MKNQFSRFGTTVAVLASLWSASATIHAATLNWTNPASGGWSTAANWNPNGVPGASDTAVITNAGVTVSLNAATTVGGILLGTNGGGTVTLSLAGQTLALNGSLTVNPSGSLTVDSGVLVGNTNAVLRGTISWVAASLNGVLTLAAGSTLNIVSGNNHDMSATVLTNHGTVLWKDGTIRGGNGTTIYNYGLWDAQNDQVFSGAGLGGSSGFHNYGTLRKSGGVSEFANATIFTGTVFNQIAGVLDVQNGTNGLQLQLLGGGNFTGGYVSTNSVGLLNLAQGNFNIKGTVTGTNTWLNGGTLGGATVLKGAWTWVVGDWNGAPDVTITSNSTLLIVSGNNHDMSATVLTNHGTVLWKDGTIRGGNGTTIYNYGLWDAQSDQVFSGAGLGGSSGFHNYGTFRKSGGVGELTGNTYFAGTVFNQIAGVLDVENSTNGLQLALLGGGNFTGGYVSTNSVGLLNLAQGNFNIKGTVTGTNTWLNGATLGGATVLKGALTWVVGDWNGAPDVTITSNSTLLIVSGNNHDMSATVLTNHGTVFWQAGPIRGGNGTRIYNYGLWDAQSDQVFSGAGLGGSSGFHNYGTFRKSGGVGEHTGNTYFAGTVFNQIAGVLDVQNSTNGLQLALLGGGNFTGGYVSTNSVGLVNLAQGNFNIKGTVTGTNTWLNGATLGGATVLKGALTWVVGDWNGAPDVTITSNSTLLIVSGNNHDMSATVLTNHGTVLWKDGTIRGGNGSTIYNHGLWDAQSDQQLNAGLGGSSGFHNFGTVRKSAGTGNTLFAGGVLFNQTSGLLSVQTGNVFLQGGGNFTGGSITNSSVGTTYLSAGNFNINGTVTDLNVIQNAGNLVGANVIHGALAWVAGLWNSATVTVATNSKVIVAGSGGNNDLNATVVTNKGTVAWASGTLRGGNGTTIYNYGLWDAQSDQQFNSGYGGATVFNNFDTFRKSGGINPAINTLFAGGVLFNQPSGVLDVQIGNVVLQGGGNFTGGSITTNSSGTTYLSFGSFNINGTATGRNVIENAGNLVGVNVIRGALNWVAGTWNSAVVTITTNSTVTVAGGGGNNDLANCSVTNHGTLAWASGTLRGGGAGSFIYNYGLWDAQSDQQLNAAFGGGTVLHNYGTFRKSAGTGTTYLVGGVLFNQPSGLLSVQTGNIQLQGSGNFTGGAVTSSDIGVLYLNAGSFNINGATTSGNVVENAGNLVGTNFINGTLTWAAGNWNGAVVTIITNSTVTVAGGGGNNDMAGCIVTNNGTVAWASGTIRGGGGAGSFIYNSGLWDSQCDQQLNAAFGGGTVFNNYGTFRKDGTSGTTVIVNGVTFNNFGKLDAQNGNIALQGAYTLANGTKMGFGLEGWLGNGSITLSGPAAFSGSLSVNLNGAFWPGVGSSFNLLNYTSESGVLFTNTALPPSFTWQTNYNPTAFVLSMISGPAVTNTAAPNLFMANLAPTHLYLAWPGDHTGWRLESQTNALNVGLRTNWFTVSGSPLTNQIFMPIDTNNPAVFFRMRYP